MRINDGYLQGRQTGILHNGLIRIKGLDKQPKEVRLPVPVKGGEE